MGRHHRKIYAFEPDEKNFRKLTRKTEGLEGLSLFNLGAWDKKEVQLFDTKGGRNSRPELTGKEVSFDSVDNVISDEVTFIKMDIEGAAIATAFSQMVGGVIPIVYFAMAKTSRVVSFSRTGNVLPTPEVIHHDPICRSYCERCYNS